MDHAAPRAARVEPQSGAHAPRCPATGLMGPVKGRNARRHRSAAAVASLGSIVPRAAPDAHGTEGVLRPLAEWRHGWRGANRTPSRSGATGGATRRGFIEFHRTA